MALTSIYDYFKNKYIIKNITNFSTKYNIEKDANGYYIIPIELLDAVNEKICIYYDIYNNHIYKKRLNILRKRRGDFKKLNVKINDIDSPPYPNNYNRLIKYRKQNKKTNNLLQTNAVIYLLNKGYKLVVNKDEVQCLPEESYKYFESHEAIDIATSLSSKLNEDYKKSITYTGNYSMLNTKKIAPSAPLYIADNNNISHNDNNISNSDNNISHNDNNISNSDNNLLRNNNSQVSLSNISLTNSNNYNNSSFIEDNIPEYHNNLKCSNPEHHNISEKVYYFNRYNSNI